MTSKHLFFKLMKEDFKQRVWLIALISLTCFFSLPVPAAAVASGERWEGDTVRWIASYTEQMSELTGVENVWMSMLVIGFAVLCAMTSFAYLNSKSKVDFYHSLPVRREKLFFANYINGIVMMAVPYAVFLLAAVFVARANGAVAAELFPAASNGFISFMVFFLVFYSVAVLAMMLTGKRVVALLGILVFFFFLPAAVSMAYAYREIWFVTYYQTGESFPHWILWLSPFTAYVDFHSLYHDLTEYGMGTWMDLSRYLLSVGAVSVIITLLDLFLYLKRPSETAGRSMAFSISKPIIRIPMVILCGLSMAAFGWGMWEQTGWSIFWLVCACVLCHCVMEIIYCSDFKKLFSHPVQLALCTGGCILLVCSLRYDWYGYDTYIPKEEEIQSSRMEIGRMDSYWLEQPEVLRQNEDGYYYLDDSYQDSYWWEHMNLDNQKAVLEIVREASAQTQIQKQQRPTRFYDVVSNTPEGEREYYSRIYVEYTLKNGRKARRTYFCAVNPVIESLAQLYDDPAYKQGMYPILGKEGSEKNVGGAVLTTIDFKERLDGLNESELRELYQVYREELSGLTFAQRMEEIPLSMIRFESKEVLDARRHNQRLSIESGEYYDELNSSEMYPIYPSFKRTIAILEKNGVHPGELPEGSIKSVEVLREQDNYDGPEKWVSIADPEEQKELLSAAMYNEYWDQNWLGEVEEGYRIKVTISLIDRDTTLRNQEVDAAYDSGYVKEYGEEYAVDSAADYAEEEQTVNRMFYFRKGRMPEFVKKALQEEGIQ